MSTYNPIIKKDSLANLPIFKTPPTAEPGTAIVLSKELHNISSSLVDASNGKITSAEIRWGGYKAFYIVNTAYNLIRLDCELSSKNPVYKFLMDVQMSCKVIDAKKIVEMNINDVREHLKPMILAKLQSFSQLHEIDEWLEVRSILNSEIVKIFTGIKYLEVRDIYCNVTINQLAREYIETKQKIENEKELEKVKISRQREVEQETHKSEMQSIQNKRELEIEKGNIDKIKMQQLHEILDGSDSNLILYDMVTDSNKGKEAAYAKNELEKAKRQEVLDYIRFALDSKVLEPQDIKRVAMNMMNKIAGKLDTPDEKGLLSEYNPTEESAIKEDISEYFTQYEKDIKGKE